MQIRLVAAANLQFVSLARLYECNEINLITNFKLNDTKPENNLKRTNVYFPARANVELSHSISLVLSETQLPMVLHL